MINELDAIKEIRDGKKLNEFNKEDITTLMKLAVIANHDDGCKEINADQWDVASARMAVTKDFRNIRVIPKEFELYCAPELSAWGKSVSRKDFREYARILNAYINEDTKQRIVRDDATNRRFFVNSSRIKSASVNNKNRSTSRPGIKITPVDSDYLDLSLIDQENGIYALDPTSFLKADTKEQTAEWLEAIVNADVLFPKTFLESLLLPNKKYIVYKKAGDEKTASFWKERIIPYLSEMLCLEIAKYHPEAAITSPSFLTKEVVMDFWAQKREILSKSEMTAYFLEFPAEFLDITMSDDIIINLDVLNHAPNVFAGTEIAFKFMSRHPKMLFEADECYQLEGLLVSGTVALNKDNVSKIKNEYLRNKIELALNI